MSTLESITQIVKNCGAIMLGADRNSLEIDEKAGPANFVTEYDKKIENILSEELLSLLPDAGFIGEEGEQALFSDKGRFFYCRSNRRDHKFHQRL